MISRNTLIGFHGQQGSGKSKLTTFTASLLEQQGYSVGLYGIKSTFSCYAEKIASDLGMEWKAGGKDLLAFKELLKAISCSIELHYKKSAWSDLFRDQVLQQPETQTLIADDMRTPMNFDALVQISEHRPVVLFRLLASEEIRRKRCSAFRENAGYTEELLEKPSSLPTNFNWWDINTELPIEESYAAIKAALGV